MGPEPPEGKEEGVNPPVPPKEPKKPAKPSVEALEEQLANKKEDLRILQEKYNASSQEGQKIPNLLKEIEDLKTELEGYKSSDEIPLDENELRKRYPDWDDLEDSEKETIKTTERNRIKTDRIIAERKKEKAESTKKEEKTRFDVEFDKTLANPEFSEHLKGKEKEFKEFCYKDENLGTPMDTLAKSFLFDSVKEKKEEKKPGEGLEPKGGGGKPEPVKEEGYTLAEVDDMIKNDPKKHRRLVESGKLKILDEE